MRGAEIGKVYSHTSLVFWSLFVFLIYCRSHWKPAYQETTQYALLFHTITRSVQRFITMAKSTSHESNITSITICFLWMAMNLWWMFKRISVARVSDENTPNSWQACNRSPAQTCNFKPPAVPKLAQIGTLTASILVPCSWNRHCITTLQS